MPFSFPGSNTTPITLTLPGLPALNDPDFTVPGVLVACGFCDKILTNGKKCGSCRVRSYCSVLCQTRDWAVHAPFCIDVSTNSEADNINSAFDRLFLGVLSAFLAEKLGIRFFTSIPVESIRSAWIVVSQSHFLHVTLQAVVNPPPGRHNRARFVSARVRPMGVLPSDRVSTLNARLAQRFPAVCIGYSLITDPNSPSRVTTITHPFPWPEDLNFSISEDRLVAYIQATQSTLANNASAVPPSNAAATSTS